MRSCCRLRERSLAACPAAVAEPLFFLRPSCCAHLLAQVHDACCYNKSVKKGYLQLIVLGRALPRVAARVQCFGKIGCLI